jgi:hypothetical protein
MERRGVWAPILGLVMAVVLFFLISFVLPDSADLVSLQQGVAVATVVAAAPVAALASRSDRSIRRALGAGMTIAGVVTTPGGNFVGPLMAIIGVLLLYTARSEARLSFRVEALALAYAIVLTVAMFSALSTEMVWTVTAVLLSTLVASSPWWGRRLISPGTQVA